MIQRNKHNNKVILKYTFSPLWFYLHNYDLLTISVSTRYNTDNI